MKQLLAYFKSIDKIWRVIWIFIFCGFITLDIVAPTFFGVTLLKLLGVGICTLYVIVNFTSDHLLVTAFVLTFIADILLAINNVSLFGLFTFILAQFFHFARLKKLEKRSIIILTVAISAYFIISNLVGKFTIYLLGAVYAFFLISNLILALKWHSSKPKSDQALCAFYGFSMFFCCDFCVAGSFFSAISILPRVAKHTFDFLAWAFYFPSQVLLSNSSKKLSKKAEL